MAKRSCQQIEESLRSKLAEAGSKDLDNDGIPDESQYLPFRNPYDPLNIGSKETGGPFNIDIGIGGASRGGPRVWRVPGKERSQILPKPLKPKVDIKTGQEMGVVKPAPKVWRRGESSVQDARKQAEAFLSGQGFKSQQQSVDKPAVSPMSQSQQERLVQQALAQGTAQPATIGDLVRAVPGLTKTKIAGTVAGGGLIGAGVGLKGFEMLSDPVSAEKERAEWLKKFDTGLQKSDQEQQAREQNIKQSQEVLDRRAKKDRNKAMKENKNSRTLEEIEQDLRARLAEQTQSKTKQMMQPMPVPRRSTPAADIPFVKTPGGEFVGSMISPGAEEFVQSVKDRDLPMAAVMGATMLPGGKLFRGAGKRLKKYFSKADDDLAALASRMPKPGEPVPGMPGQYYTGEITAAGKPKTTSVAPKQPEPTVKPTVKAEPEAPAATTSTQPIPKKPFLQSQEKYLQSLSKDELERLALIKGLAPEKMSLGTKALIGGAAVGLPYLAYKSGVPQMWYKQFQKDPVQAITNPIDVTTQQAGEEFQNWITEPTPGSTLPPETSKKNQKNEAIDQLQLQEKQQLDYDALIRNPNVRVMLDLISRAEGNTNYDTLVGGGRFKDFSSHPKTVVKIKSKDQTITSDAAGRYQIMGRNWEPYSKRLGLTDFSPESQDKIAVAMLADRGALNSVLDGNFEKAIKQTKSQWTSLPASDVVQGYGPRSWKWVDANLAAIKKDYGIEDTPTQVAQADKSAVTKQPAAKAELKPGYYAVGDSQAVGVAGYGGKDWNRTFARTGASILDPKQFETHLANIERIPKGSVVAISGGGNDINSAKPEVIANQLNKLIAAAQARELQVIHLLPTSTDNPRTQQTREALRQAMINNQTLAPIMDLGQASKKDPMNLHLDRKEYQRIANNITLMLPIGSATATKTTKNQPPAAPVAKKTEPETFVDKLGRVASGELVSQVFGDKKKPVAQPSAQVTTQDKQQSKDKQVTKDSEPSWVEKLYGIPQARERIQARKAEIEKREQKRKEQEKKAQPRTVQSVSGTSEYPDQPAVAPSTDQAPKKATATTTSGTGLQGTEDKTLKREREKRELARQKNLPMQPPSLDPELDPKGWEEYSDYMEKRQIASGDQYSREREARLAREKKAAEKSVDKDVSSLLQKDQAGLKTAYKGSAGAQAIMQQNPDIIKDVNRIRAGDTIKVNGQDYTIKAGDTLDRIARKMKTSAPSAVSASPSLGQGEELIDLPAVTSTSATDRFTTSKPELEPPKPSEIQTALKDFKREQDTSNKDNAASGALFTASDKELAKEQLFRNLGINDTDDSDEDPIERIIRQSASTNANPEYSTTDGSDEDPIERIIRQSVDKDAELKESINKQTLAELHDILRLAGRTK